MKVTRVAWEPYRVAFRSPFRTAHGVMRAREGLIVRLTTDEGFEGIGEVAPLPEFDGATLVDCMAAVEAIAPGLAGTPLAGLALCLDELAGGPVPSAVRCALDVAALDALGKRRGVPVAALFAAEPRGCVEANATVPAVEIEAAVRAARKAAEAGYRTVKLKVGTGSVADDVARVAAVRAAVGSTLRLRLDANGGWAEVEAMRALDELAGLGIELVEQPVPAAELDALARVRGSSPIPLAADEAVLGLEAARRVVDAGAADCLVVKPSVAGGITAARAIDDLARAAGIATIVTTALEVGPGIAAALHAAATLPPGTPACGVATGGVFETPLVEGLPQPGPTMRLPEGPGLGVRVAER